MKHSIAALSNTLLWRVHLTVFLCLLKRWNWSCLITFSHLSSVSYNTYVYKVPIIIIVLSFVYNGLRPLDRWFETAWKTPCLWIFSLKLWSITEQFNRMPVAVRQWWQTNVHDYSHFSVPEYNKAISLLQLFQITSALYDTAPALTLVLPRCFCNVIYQRR